MTDLRVTLVQTSLEWHNPEANRAALSKKLEPVKGSTDLIVLPEMFTSGFTSHPEDIEAGSHTVEWLREQACQLNAAITGSIACHVVGSDSDKGDTNKTYVNRLLFVTPEGELQYYDKVHLFRMGGEHKRYQAGEQRCVISYKGWRLLMTVCYDLRFPVFCRNTTQEDRYDYDAMVCVANWPESRREHWRTLLKARAIENQAFVVGVNRVGVDGNNLSYSGDSLAVDCYGTLLVDETGEWVNTVQLSQKAMLEYRQKFPVWQDADSFSLEH
ncbi:MAG: amidohydrolase [Cellvibrionaceae bacterium]